MYRIRSEIKGLLLFAGIFLFVLTFDILAVYIYFGQVMDFINRQPQTIKGDAGVIFFGDYKEGGKVLGTDSKNRADKAIILYKSANIKKVICVGGYYYQYWKGKPHLMKKYLVENEVVPVDILYDSASYNTLTNWREARKIINRCGFDTVIAISAPLHLYRISEMVDFQNTYYATYAYDFKCLNDYWILFKDVHHEFVSQALNMIMKDELRNKLVLIYGFISNHLEKIF